MTPEEAAEILALDGMQREENRPFLVALQYLGLLDIAEVMRRFPGKLVADDPVAEILAAAPEPEPRYPRGPSTLMDPPPTAEQWPSGTYQITGQTVRPAWRPIRWADASAPPRPKQTKQAQAAFAAWVEGDRDYEPGIAGNID